MGLKKLGKGLSDLGLNELLSDLKAPTTLASTRNAETHPGWCYLPITQLIPGPYQPRQKINEEGLAELAHSIRSQGVIQPLIVRPLPLDSFEIIAGERRWRAAQRAGLEEVPVIIRDVAPETAMIVALIENIQRAELSAIEEAQAIQRLIAEFHMTHEGIAASLGKSRATITNLLRLLNLEPPVKTLLLEGEIDMGHARALLSIVGEQQLKAAQDIVFNQLSVRDAEHLVRQYQQQQATPTSVKSSLKTPRDPDITRLQNRLSEQLSAKVLIQHQVKGKGRLVIHYHSLDELEGILEHIQ